MWLKWNWKGRAGNKGVLAFWLQLYLKQSNVSINPIQHPTHDTKAASLLGQIACIQYIVTTVLRSVCVSVGHKHELSYTGWTNCDIVLAVDCRMPNEPCIRWRPDPLRKGIIWGRILQCGLSSKFVDHLLPLPLAKHLRSVFLPN